MISYMLTVCNLIPEITGLVAAVIECCSVVALCVARIVKMFHDIKKAKEDDDPDDNKQISDIIDNTIKDIKGDIKNDNKKQ